MVLNKYLLAASLAVNSICLAGGVMAATAPHTEAVASQVPDQLQSVAGAARDDKQDADELAQDVANAVVNEKQNVQVEKNSEAIQDLTRLTGNQTFILQLVGIFMPLLSLLATGSVAYFQYKAKLERHAMAQESRSNLGHMGRSINGMKSELVAAVKAAAFAEGATHALSPNTDPESIEQLRNRAKQLAKEAEDASRRAALLADEAVRKIEAKPEDKNSP